MNTNPGMLIISFPKEYIPHTVYVPNEGQVFCVNHVIVFHHTLHFTYLIPYALIAAIHTGQGLAKAELPWLLILVTSIV